MWRLWTGPSERSPAAYQNGSVSRSGADRLGALEVRDGGEHAVLARGVEAGRLADDPQVALALQPLHPGERARRVRRGDVLADRRRHVDEVAARLGVVQQRPGLAGRGRVAGEDAAAEPAFAGPREVDVAAFAPPAKSSASARVRVSL